MRASHVDLLASFAKLWLKKALWLLILINQFVLFKELFHLFVLFQEALCHDLYDAQYRCLIEII